MQTFANSTASGTCCDVVRTDSSQIASLTKEDWGKASPNQGHRMCCRCTH